MSKIFRHLDRCDLHARRFDPVLVHTAEEYIMLKEIEEAVGIYLELLDGLLI